MSKLLVVFITIIVSLSLVNCSYRGLQFENSKSRTYKGVAWVECNKKGTRNVYNVAANIIGNTLELIMVDEDKWTIYKGKATRQPGSNNYINMDDRMAAQFALTFDNMMKIRGYVPFPSCVCSYSQKGKFEAELQNTYTSLDEVF